jgi:hypothetical protein
VFGGSGWLGRGVESGTRRGCFDAPSAECEDNAGVNIFPAYIKAFYEAEYA